MYYALDILLLLGLTLRLSRLATTDTITEWYVHEPLRNRAFSSIHDDEDDPRTFAQRMFTGLLCPFCIGFWIAIATTLSLYAVGGVGDAQEWWRWTAGAFTLNYIAGHLSARLD